LGVGRGARALFGRETLVDAIAIAIAIAIKRFG
jgi:hypothetical protein